MKIKLMIGILISVLFLWISFSRVDFTEFLRVLQSSRYWLLLPAMGLAVLIYLVRAYRWKHLILSREAVPYVPVFSAVMIGFFANNVLPMRAGEFLRAYVINRNLRIPMGSAFASILVERLIDVFSLLLIAAAGLIFLPIPHNEHFYTMRTAGFILFTVETAALAFIVLLLWKRDGTLKLTNAAFSVLPVRIRGGAVKMVESFIEGLDVLRRARHIPLLIWTTTAVWAITFINIYLITSAFQVDLVFSERLVAIIVVLIFSNIALTIPSGPGFIGTFHLAVQQSFLMFAVPGSAALGIAFLLHASAYIPQVIIGFLYFLRENIRFAAVRKEQTGVESTEKGIS